MSGNWLKYAAFGSLFLAVVLGLVAYRWTASLNARQAAEEAERARQEQPAPVTLAVVALRPLPANEAIGADDVALKPVSVVPTEYFASVQDAVGRIPQIDIDAGAPVTPRYFRQVNLLARIIPEGHLAMSLEISDVVAVGGFVRPGDEVDLLLHVRGANLPSQARVLLRRTLVLAYEERIIERPEGLEPGSTEQQRRRRVRTAVVAVPAEDTTRVMLGASIGDIRLALHRVADEDDTDTGLPRLPPAETGSDPAEIEQLVTLAELTRLKQEQAQDSDPLPPPYVIDVYRGSDVKQVSD